MLHVWLTRNKKYISGVHNYSKSVSKLSYNLLEKPVLSVIKEPGLYNSKPNIDV